MNTAQNEPPAILDSHQAAASALRIVLVYAVFAALWILLSDKAVEWLFRDPARITLAGMIKGWLFVAVTALLLYGLIRHLLGQILTASRRELDAQREKNRAKKLLDEIADSSTDAIFAKDLAGRYLLFNRETARVVGKSAEQVLGCDDELLFPEQAEMLRANDRKVMAGKATRTFEEKLFTVDGERTYLATKGPLHDEDGGIIGIFGISRDITERKHAEEALRIAAIAFEAQEGIFITDERKLILQVNQAFTDITGYSAGEALGKTPALLSSGRHDEAFFASMARSISDRGTWQGEIWNRRKNGEIYPEWLTISAVRNVAGEITNYVATLNDMTLRKQTEDRIRTLAFYDPLTALPNRQLLRDRLEKTLAANARHQSRSALLFIDLDNFKTLNDTLGHDKGDLLLQQVARRLLACVREGDTVARLGGDEFVVILEDLSGNLPEAASQAEAVGEKILASLCQTYQLAGHEHHGTASIGITLSIDHQDSVEDLLKRADLSMYEAKAAGRNTLRFYDPAMQAVVSARASLEASLRESIQKRHFLLYYQAQVSDEGRLTGVEALVRWKHPLRGIVSPAEFIPLAEESGLILPLGQWVLESACQQLTRWAVQPAMAHLTVAVNVSARQFRQADFVEQVMLALERSGANPQKLKLELTESVLVFDIENVIGKMSALKEKGVGFALDDFGTGYSSLSYLKRLPLDQLKIDQGFVRDILSDANDAAIARMVIALGASLGLTVIAEGVESEAQRAFLEREGCHAYQGYFFSRPLPPEEFETFVKRR